MIEMRQFKPLCSLQLLHFREKKTILNLWIENRLKIIFSLRPYFGFYQKELFPHEIDQTEMFFQKDCDHTTCHVSCTYLKLILFKLKFLTNPTKEPKG